MFNNNHCALGVVLLGWLSAGCAEDPVFTMTGVITDAPANGNRVPDASLTVYNSKFRKFSTERSDTNGIFEIEIPNGETFFFTSEAEDLTSSSFVGFTSGQLLVLDEGAIWMRTPETLADLRDEFSACPEAQLEGGIIEGEIRLLVAPNQPGVNQPIMSTAELIALDDEDFIYPACYLDDSGDSVEGLEQTGETGRFIIFGIPSGPVRLVVSYVVGESEPEESVTTYYMPESGTVPVYPLVVSPPSF